MSHVRDSVKPLKVWRCRVKRLMGLRSGGFESCILCLGSSQLMLKVNCHASGVKVVRCRSSA